jgi:hypothetical protein
MISKNDILELKNKIDQTQKQINEIENIKADLCRELLEKVLGCPEILNQSAWDFPLDDSLVSNTNAHRLLSDFLQTTYHCHFETDDVFLYFDDNDIRISFKKPESLSVFLKTYNVQIKTKAVESQICRLKADIKREQEELKGLEENLEFIKLTNKTNALPTTTCDS